MSDGEWRFFNASYHQRPRNVVRMTPSCHTTTVRYFLSLKDSYSAVNPWFLDHVEVESNQDMEGIFGKRSGIHPPFVAPRF